MSYREVSEIRDGMQIEWDMPIKMDDGLFQSLRADVLRRYGFDARSRHIALFGVCRDCQSRDAVSGTVSSADAR